MTMKGCSSFQLNKLNTQISSGKEKVICKLRGECIKSALELKLILCSRNMNVVTIESVTSGLIASTLTDVSHGGQYLYGGFVVYDIDAKRRWTEVTSKNVYNKVAVKEMAEGAIKNSRAMMSIAISGNATPFKDSLDCVGVAHLGVSVREKESLKTKVVKINVCERVKEICSTWKKNHTSKTYPSLEDTMYLNNVLRHLFTLEAIKFAIKILSKHKKPLGYLDVMAYDDTYSEVYEPSDIINFNLKHRKTTREWPVNKKANSLCSDRK